jgi:hypothetical protein
MVKLASYTLEQPYCLNFLNTVSLSFSLSHSPLTIISDDAVTAILEAETIPETINLFKFGDSALQLYGAAFLRNLVEHGTEPARASIQTNVINELSDMLTSSDRLIMIEASKTLIEFAKYGMLAILELYF